jgi:glycerol-3-phosphate dehydrogenase
VKLANQGGRITRDLDLALERGNDLVIIGGGAYGALMALEAARKGLKPLLVERDDFGGATTWNTTRFVHGGLRYLQSMDLVRSLESVRERRWFFRHFPDYMQALPCLMPLYGGLKGPAVFRLAMEINDLLSWRRNIGVRQELWLWNGRVLSANETSMAFPLAERGGLKGGVLWHDGFMRNPGRILIETLRWACALGAVALNYVEVTGLISEGNKVRGVEILDKENGRTYKVKGQVIVNCAGAQVRALARRMDRDVPRLMRPVLLLNLLLDLPSVSTMGVGVRAQGKQGVHFLLPVQGMTLAGTYHVPAREDETPEARPEHVEGFLESLNRAAPGLSLGPQHVLRVFSGWLPAARECGLEIAHRPVMIDHGADGGPAGFYSLSGIKWTTARPAVERSLRQLFRNAGPPMPWPEDRVYLDDLPELDFNDFSSLEGKEMEIKKLARDESVLRLDDLVLRRTDWGVNPRTALAAAEQVSRMLDWDPRRQESELERFKKQMGNGAYTVTQTLRGL